MCKHLKHCILIELYYSMTNYMRLSFGENYNSNRCTLPLDNASHITLGIIFERRTTTV